jgi:hypothetical protein
MTRKAWIDMGKSFDRDDEPSKTEDTVREQIGECPITPGLIS